MKNFTLIAVGVLTSVASLGAAISTNDKYNVKVRGGLAFSEFKGFEDWSVISLSAHSDKLAIILGNPVLINAYKSGIPSNGKAFPEGSKLAKLQYLPETRQTEPGVPTVPAAQKLAEFMVKDSTRFAETGGWGYASFNYNPVSDAFTPATETSTPPQGHDAKCGAACHVIAKNRDFVFTQYAHR
jgi:hypothetical protein